MDRRSVGDEAEDRVAAWLEQQGYRIRDRNWTCRYGELDVVAERGEYLCFVEVRMRSTGTWGDPSATVSFAKQRKVVRAALHYLKVYPAPERAIRFDVVSVTGRGDAAKLEHIPAAFDAGM
jgi:putative endonuclease